MSASWSHSPGAGPEDDSLQTAINLEGKEGGKLYRCIPGLVTACLIPVTRQVHDLGSQVVRAE